MLTAALNDAKYLLDGKVGAFPALCLWTDLLIRDIDGLCALPKAFVLLLPEAAYFAGFRP